MNEVNPSTSATSRKAYQVVLIAGLVAGVLDITAALASGWIRSRTRPVLILHAIASGLLGRSSYSGGFKTAALGFALHFLIALGAASAYYAASRRLRFLVSHAITCGMLYGVAVYLFMNQVVLPLSAVTFKRTFSFSSLAIGLVIHMLCVGLPISLVVRQYSK